MDNNNEHQQRHSLVGIAFYAVAHWFVVAGSWCLEMGARALAYAIERAPELVGSRSPVAEVPVAEVPATPVAEVPPLFEEWCIRQPGHYRQWRNGMPCHQVIVIDRVEYNAATGWPDDWQQYEIEYCQLRQRSMAAAEAQERHWGWLRAFGYEV